MNNRFNYAAHASELNKKMFDLTVTSKKTTLDYGLHHLVHILASQINGCAFCVDMHTKEAKIHGERELRLYHLPIWRESSLIAKRPLSSGQRY
jgi:AhpD family alkylhydroperoxidase